MAIGFALGKLVALYTHFSAEGLMVMHLLGVLASISGQMGLGYKDILFTVGRVCLFSFLGGMKRGHSSFSYIN